MDKAYTVAIWLEPPAELWPSRTPIQLQRDFARRVGACTWGKFAYDLIPWAAREYVVCGWDAERGLELVLGDGSGERAVDALGKRYLRAQSPLPCVVCERAGSLRLYVGDEVSVGLCDRCGRSKMALLATLRAMRVERVALRARGRG